MENLNERPEDMPPDEELIKVGHMCLWVGPYELHLDIYGSEIIDDWPLDKLKELVMKAVEGSLDQLALSEEGADSTKH